MLGNVATLTGLLGTITGMIQAVCGCCLSKPSDESTRTCSRYRRSDERDCLRSYRRDPSTCCIRCSSKPRERLAEDLNQAALKAFNWLSYTFDPITVESSVVKASRSSRSERVKTPIREIVRRDCEKPDLMAEEEQEAGIRVSN
jgi:biopolymer transport protein ExbB